MSNAEKFFKLYDELASEYPDHKGFIETLGVKSVGCFRQRMNTWTITKVTIHGNLTISKWNLLIVTEKKNLKKLSIEEERKKKVIARHYLEKAWNVEE